MHFTTSVSNQENRKKFVVVPLIRLCSDLVSVQDQILTLSVIPPLEDVSARLMCISLTTFELISSEYSIMANAFS